MIWSLILAWTAERKVNVHHSCIKVQEIVLFLSWRMGVQLLLYIKVRLPYRDIKNWMWLPWDIQRKNFLPPALLWGSSFTWTLPQNAVVQVYFAFGKRTHLEISWHFWFAGVAGRRMTVEGKASPEHCCSSGISNQKVRKRKSWQEEYTSQISFSSRLLYGNPSLIEKATELPGVSSRLQGFFCPKDAAPGRPKEKVASAFVSSSSNTLNYWFRKQFVLDKPPCSWSESAESPTVPEPSNPVVTNTMVSLKDSTDLPGFLPSGIGRVSDSSAEPVEPPAFDHSCFPKPFSSLCCTYFTLLWDLHWVDQTYSWCCLLVAWCWD